MPSLEEVVTKHNTGHIFWLSPHLLGMTPETFDSFARRIWAAGGGEGFETLTSGKRVNREVISTCCFSANARESRLKLWSPRGLGS